jgi:hypothetical protein
LIRILAVRMNLVKLPRPVVTRAAEKKTQKPDHRANLPLFAPPGVFAKCLPARRMVGRAGGDRIYQAAECMFFISSQFPLTNSPTSQDAVSELFH